MRRNTMRGVLLVGTAIGLATPAFAQESGLAVEEIVVTAQKREQALQDVPMAVSAVAGETLQDAGVTSVQGLTSLVPSLSATQSNQPVHQSYRIRGIGSDPNTPTFEPDVALFIDGVYMPRTGLGVDDLVDLERVEVLKGPQSTLYGKNATAGVVNIVTAGPSDSFAARLEGSLSSIEGGRDAIAWRLAGSITGPIGERARGRLTGVYYDAGPTYENLTAGVRDANSMRRYAVRGQLEVDLNDLTTLNLTAAHTEMFDTDTTNADLYYGAPGEGGAYDVDHHPVLTGLLGVTPCADNNPTNRVICSSDPTRSTSRTDMVSAALTSDLGFATLTSITAWSQYRSMGVTTDIDQISLPLASVRDVQEGDSVSQEIRLVSPSGGAVEWLAGAYYLKSEFARGDHGRSPFFTLQPGAALLPLPLPASTAAALAPLSAGVASLNPLMGALGIPTISTPVTSGLVLGQSGDRGYLDSRTESEYFAVFGQATLAFNDRFSATVGLRWQTEDKTASLDNRAVTSPNPYVVNAQASLNALLAHPATPAPVKAQLPMLIGAFASLSGVNILNGVLTPSGVNGVLPPDSSDNLTWTVTGSYTPNDDTLIYATVARGSKSGGHNIGFGNAPAAARPFRGETVTNYEVGAKLDLFDRRARIALAAFHTEYEDYQNAGFVGLQFLVNNAEAVTVDGFEFDGVFALAEGLTATAGATVLDARFEDYDGGACYFGRAPDSLPVGGVFTSCSLSGMRMPLTPRVRLTSSLQYERTVSLGEVYARADASWQSDMNTNAASLDPRGVQEGLGLLNARLGLRTDNDLDLSVWANNLTNETTVQLSGVMNLFNTRSEYQTFLGAPRQIGLTVRKSF
ncbi:MAG: TonB-dependent receptor [Pseudomonadota bacterium]